MKVLITGGLGFVGRELSIRLLRNGHEVTIVDQAPMPSQNVPSRIRYIPADTSLQGPWQLEVGSQDLVINLAGTYVFRKWNTESKKLIYESRILTTRNVVNALSDPGRTRLFSTSAIAYYGFRSDENLTELSAPGNDFLARVCVDWEKEARNAERRGFRVVITRLGLVLGRGGGALKEMTTGFQKYLGGPVGSGNQWVSWIHLEDLIDAFMFLMDHHNLRGPVNCCSPNPVRNRDMSRMLGEILQRPSSVATPQFVVKLALGEFANVLLESQRVYPAVLLKQGFRFKHPDIGEALREILAGGEEHRKSA